LGQIDFSTWHAVVAGSSLIAAALWVCSRGCRLHSAAVLLSGLVWAATFLFALGASVAIRAPEHDVGSAIGDAVTTDCGGLFLAGCHLALCAALGLQVLRVARRSTEAQYL